MRKLLAITLMLLMLQPLVGITEVNVDVDSMSYEELVALLEKVQLALFSHTLMEGFEIPGGKYVVGKHIPAGTYVISAVGEEISVWIKTYYPESESEYDEENIWGIENREESYVVALADGMILDINISFNNGKLIIKPFANLFLK